MRSHIAAQSGIDVRIMIPSSRITCLCTGPATPILKELLDSGIRAYTYENGFLHAKTIVIDGLAASVGSANWDIRSFKTELRDKCRHL